MKPEDLVTAKQIADHAGVTRQAVSLWAARDDFPEQWVPGYWQWRQVEKWLRQHRAAKVSAA